MTASDLGGNLWLTGFRHIYACLDDIIITTMLKTDIQPDSSVLSVVLQY